MSREPGSSETPVEESSAAQRQSSLEVMDPRAIRALTHPIRLALLEALELEGQLTATEAGRLIGQAPNSCSFHFRQLAKYGFVEEAGPAPGHARPWRLTTDEVRLSDAHDDPERTGATRALKTMAFERYFSRIVAFDRARSRYPAQWRRAAGFEQSAVHVTAEELEAINAEVSEIWTRYADRNDPSRRPSDSLPVELVLFASPLRPPGDNARASVARAP